MWQNGIVKYNSVSNRVLRSITSVKKIQIIQAYAPTIKYTNEEVGGIYEEVFSANQKRKFYDKRLKC